MTASTYGGLGAGVAAAELLRAQEAAHSTRGAPGEGSAVSVSCAQAA